jgi:CHASE3 domain sensor protein
MTPETEQQREKRATDLAYAQGRREADVDSHLRSHETRLNAINGSIERHAQNAQALKDSIVELGGKVDAIAATLVAQREVEEDRVQQIKDANEKQISNKQFWVGVATICAMIVIGVATLFVKAHGG